MKKLEENYKTERNIIYQYSYSMSDSCAEDIAELKARYPHVEIIKNTFPSLNKYWLSVVIPLP